MLLSMRCFVVVLAGAACAANGAIMGAGTYRLQNHPDGSASPPQYGLRLDELYNATSGHDQFTFDFEAPGSNMQMTLTASTIRIFGVVFGGRDIGSGYAADAYRGFYTVDFLYNTGVGLVPGDDDIRVVAPMGSNSGSIISPLGDTFTLTDKPVDGYTFRLGDENNDLGHRGFNGTSGWGWLLINGVHTDANDWLFTVPTPGVAGLMGAGLLVTARRRRA
jgi:hypothetical protein